MSIHAKESIHRSGVAIVPIADEESKRKAIQQALLRATDLKSKALADLAAVVLFAIERSTKPSTRARLVMPWIDQAQELGCSWIELADVLTPIIPSAVGNRINEIRRRSGDIDLSHAQRRLADAAGVDLPDCVGDLPIDPTQKALLRVIEKLADERIAKTHPGRMQAREIVTSKPAAASPTLSSTDRPKSAPAVVPKSRFTDLPPLKKSYAERLRENEAQVERDREAVIQSRLKNPPKP